MGEGSLIAWTDHTFNPWRGCAKVSPGCKFCYAETFVTKRQGLPLWGVGAERKIAAPSTWKEPLRWNREAQAQGRRARVFCASLADVFEPREDLDAARRQLAQLIDKTPWLDWLLLTKRPGEMIRLGRLMGWEGAWPSNVWAGTTTENQEQAERRIPRLLEVPARIRFLSCEPLLEPVHLGIAAFNGADSFGSLEGLSWVIVGGESGPGARPFDLAWARSIKEECGLAGTPFFFKQTGSNAWEGPPELSVRYRTKHPKGGDPAEWPLDLQIQRFPT